MDNDNVLQEDAEMKAISQGLHQLYDPVLDEPVPEYLRARIVRRSSWRTGAIAAGWVAVGLAVGAQIGRASCRERVYRSV